MSRAARVRRLRLAPVLLALAAAAGCRAEVPADVAASAEETRPLAVGAALPEVELRDVDGRPVRLDALVADGPIALVFYRGGW